ncbi:hypothetical protein GPJ56_008560 [Histomonas meleagridis]|uniref:uncharacterized protein n=1 Tax=Histomonas meleagridis TaxID=135588 RepID=UPI003559A781|nr:hypothetical protein GPJ56_008560 [Histomonas meleagridis]KAH0798301.1 hypothetical protein GO595_008850 [Histomonas meleagridis]
MDDELKIKIQWLPGAILPVVTHGSSTAAELADLLQFSCFDHERVYLFHNGSILNPSDTLSSQGIKKGDVVECKIVGQIEKFEELFPKENQSIAREMARVLDMRTDKIYERKEMSRRERNSSCSDDDDDDSYQFLMMEGSDLTTSNDISTDPLPIIWQNNEYDDIPYIPENNIRNGGTQRNSDPRNEPEKVFTQ